MFFPFVLAENSKRAADLPPTAPLLKYIIKSIIQKLQNVRELFEKLLQKRKFCDKIAKAA